MKGIVNPIETDWDAPTASAVEEPSRGTAPVAAAMVMPAGNGHPPVRMTQAQLIENYAAIVRARAIFYPVAYQFLRELGRGRQGVVFLGLRQGARGCVTRHGIKLFDPSNYASPEQYWTDMGRIAMQTSRLQTMQSPNLVARDSYEETYGIGYLQMEAIEGVDLRGFLEGAHLTHVRDRATRDEWARFTDVIFRIEGDAVRIQPGIAIYIMRMMLRGLEALHAMGFVHGDVKPANTMVDRLGYVKLVDFGRAVSIGEPSTWLLGTPVYMAPEIHRRQPPTVQSDLYSTGLVGVEMLRGDPVTEALSKESDLLAFKLTLPERLPELLPPYVRRNERFVRTLQRMLDPDPAKRFVSTSDADSGPEGLLYVHKQLVHMGKDTEYGRELEHYLAKVVSPQFGSSP
jgi:serine/threonine protein kinase